MEHNHESRNQELKKDKSSTLNNLENVKIMKLLLQNTMKIPIMYILLEVKMIPENHNYLVSKGLLTNHCKHNVYM